MTIAVCASEKIAGKLLKALIREYGNSFELKRRSHDEIVIRMHEAEQDDLFTRAYSFATGYLARVKE